MIFGTDNARLGVENLFELFQDVRLNKHLFYVRTVFIQILSIFSIGFRYFLARY